MNKIHQLIWSARLGCCVAVSEVASSAGARRSSGARRARRLGAATAVSLAVAAMGQAMAQVAPAPTTLPTGGQVVQGQANLRGVGSMAAPVLNIDQGSQRAVINWGTFNLGAAATVNFNQPNAQAATLNRVQDMNPSQIFGHINAPGQVTLINPAGVYFSPGAVLDVGALTATTLQQSDADFMAGGANFTRSGSTGSVVNAGSLQAALGGYIALLAPEVRNEGLIVAQQGTVALASGEAIRLNFDPQSRLTSMTVTPSQIAALVENKTAVQVGGGQILLSATAVSGLQGSVVNSGSLSASSLTAKGGRIVLEGDSVTLAPGSSMAARGATGGGTVLVGGDWQGAAGTYQATTVTMAGDASIDASATQSGDGGKVVLWSDVGNANSSTTVNGSISVRGGALGGNGGKVETSGHAVDSSGARINAGADQGTGGLWLIDPADLTIDQTIANGYQTTLNGGGSVLNDVTGNLTWNSGVTLSKSSGGAGTLTLRTTNNGSITLNNSASITSTSTDNPLNLVLWTRYNDEGGAGTIFLDRTTIDTKGGHVSLSGGIEDPTLWHGLSVGGIYANTHSTGTYGINLTGTSINTGAGSIQIKGQSNYTGGTTGTSYGLVIAGGSSLTTTTGTIDLVGDLKGTYANGVGVLIGSSTAAGNVTIASDSGAINITGTGADQGGSGTGWRHAVFLKADTGDQVAIKSTSGAITLTGAASFSASNFTNNDSSGLQFQVNTTASGIQVVSQTGAISLIGSNTLEAAAQNVNGIRFNPANTADSIRIGYDGSNAYSGDILIQSNSIQQLNNNAGVGSLSVQSTGTLTVQSAGNAFTYLRAGGSTLTFDNDWNFGTGLSAFTLGKSTNTLDLTLSNALTTAGPVSLYGGNLNLNANLTTTAAGAGIVAKARSNINGAAGSSGSSRTLQTNNGAITLWADSDSSAGGYIYLGDYTTLNSANGSTLTTATGGGAITLGGGAGTTAPTGYASAVSGSTANGLAAAGVILGTHSASTRTTLTNFYSGGGNVSISGKSDTTSPGLAWYDGGTLQANGGTIALNGTSTSSHGMELHYFSGANTPTLLSSASGTAISLNGSTTSGSANNGVNGAASLQSTGTGGISMTASSTNGLGIGGTWDALAASGPIVLDGGTRGISVTGTFGKKASTNVTSSSSNVTFTGDNVAFGGASTVDTTGTLTVQPSSTSFSSALSWGTNVTVAPTVSALTLGKTSNTADITVTTAQNIAGPVSIYGGNLNLNANLTSTLAGAAILAKASGNIISAASISLKTNNGNLTLWSDSDNNSVGSIALGDNNTLNTSLNGASTSQATGGGKMTLAGGADSNADGIPDGYSFSATDQGLSLGTSATNTTTMYSGGGDVLMKGKTSATSGGYRGIKSYNALTLNSGQGAISMVGESAAGYGVQFSGSSVTSGTTLSLTSAKTSGTAISITGSTTLLNSHGVVFDNSAIEDVLATGGGSIAINGTGNGTGYGVWLQNTNVLASTGAITIDGGTKGITVATGANIGKSTSGVTTSSSNVTLTGDVFSIGAASTVNTTGTLTVQPYSTSFAGALSWPLSNLTVTAGLTGLTLGKLGNLANITVTSDQSINGPISIYGGNVALSAHLAATATATATDTMVRVLASGDITLAANKTVTTQGGAVLFNSDADGSVAGAIVLSSGSGITSNNGNITLGGGIAGTGAGNAIGDSAATAGIAIGGTLNVGTGALVAQGQGYAGANYNHGIALNTATITASGAGTINLTGTGGAGTGTDNKGINGNGTLTGGSSGALTLTGIGGAAAGGYNHGLNLGSTTVIGSGGGNVNLVGTGGGGSSGSSNDGIYLSGTSVNSGVGGLVSVTGTSGQTTGGYNNGVQLVSSTTINSSGGTNVTGFGRGSGGAGTNYGVDLEATSVITATGNAPVVVAGSAVGGTGSGNFGVVLQNSSSIGSGGGTINVNGTGNVVSGGLGVYVGNTAAIASGGNAAVTITTDSITVGGNGISAGTGTVTVQNRSAGTQINLGGADVLTGSTLTLGLNSTELNLITAGTLVVGRNDGAATGVMTVSNTVSRPSSTNLTLKTNSALTLDLNAALTLGTNSTLTLTAAGSVSQSTNSNITATNLLLNGTGSYTLDTATGNSVDTLAASGTGALRYKDSNGLTIGAVGGVNGINAVGAVAIGSGGAGNGDLTVAQGVATTDASGGAIVLNAGVAASPVTSAGTAATGGNIVLSGSPVITTGTGGSLTFMTGAVSNAALTARVGSGSGNFRYHSDETTNFSPAVGGGTYALYREQPTVTLLGATASMVYGAAVPTPLVTTSGAVNGDVITPTGAVGGTTSSSGNYTVAGPHTITPDTAAITALGYAVSVSNGALTVTPKGLTVNGSTAGNKVYDRTANATVTGGTLVGVVGIDVVTLVQAGNFATTNVGTGIAVTAGDSIGNTDSGNYSLTQPTGLSADITPKGLTVNGSTAGNKVYDRNTTATVTGGTLVGVISGDTVTLTQAGSFATANAGTGIAVSASDTIAGAQAGNYALTQPTGLSADITPKGLTVNGSTAGNKVYDRNTTATVTGGTLVGVISGDTVTLTQAGSFATANAGTGIAVSASDTIAGAQAGNYALTQPTGLSADITPKGLTVNGSTAGNKVYDRNTTATVTGGTLVGVISGDTVTLTQAGSFATANAGTGIAVSASDTIAGAQAGNYALTQPTGLSADITPKGLTVNGSTAGNKVYDQTADATITGGTLVGVISGDTVTLTQAGSFATANAGTSIAVSASDTLGGAQGGNYALTQPTGLSADITPKGLTVNGSTAGNKVYDQTADATITGGTLVGVISGDTVTLTQAGSFATANAGTSIAVSASDTLGGAQAGNYALTQPTGLSADITPKGLTVSGSAASNKVYDQTATATITGGTLVGVISGDTVTLTQAGSFATANAGTSIAVSTSDTIAGAQAGNYALTQPTGLSADITPKGLTVNGSTAGNKAYDQTATATITGGTLVGVISGDTVTLTQAGSFATANAGTGIAVSASDTIAGAQAGNYALTQPTGLSADITPKGLTVSGSAASNKVYDQTATATITGGALVGVISGDTVTLTQAGSFATANAGTGIAVSASDTIAGAQAGNYALTQPTGLSADITPKGLTVNGSTAGNKAYDQTATATITGGTLVGVISGDTVTLTQAGSFATANAGTGIAVSASDTIAGAQAGNYALTQPTGLSADITPRGLTVSGITAANKVYDATNAATISTAGAVYTGLIAGDAVTVSTTGSFDDKNVGNGKTVNLVSSHGGADLGNYSITDQTTTTAKVTPAALTVAGITAVNKVYDATMGATVSTAVASYTGLFTGDSLTVNATGSFSDKDVAAGKTVTLVSSYTGGDLGNYSITPQTSTTANITPAALTVTANADARFVTQADRAGFHGVSYDGLAGVETSSVLGGTLVITRPNAATDVAAGTYVGALVPSGYTSGNYSISYANGNYTVAPANKLLVRTANTSVVYGSTPSLTVISAEYLDANNATIHTLTGSGTGNSFSYADGAGGSVSFVLTPSGATTSTAGKTVVGNFALTDAAPAIVGSNFNALVFVGNLAVTPKTVSATASGVTKVYDGNTSMTGVTLGLTGKEANDLLTVSGTGAFAQKNVGSALSYTIGGMSLGGADVGNYVLSGGATLAGSDGAITPKALTVSGITAANKIYNASTAATVTTAALTGASGLVAGDDVSLSASGTFADKNVGNGKTVTLVSNYGGTDRGNYSITGQAGTTADITPAALSVSNITAASKVYDATTAAAVSTAGANYAGLFAGDAVSVGATGAFSDKNVANSKTVTLASSYTGADVGNYTITGQTSVTADITPKGLTVTGITAADKVYDATSGATVNTAGASYAGLIAGDALSLSATGAFTDKNVANGKTVNLTSSYTGADVGNYSISDQAGTTANITPKSLTVTGSAAASKVYDKTTAATVTGGTLVGLVGGDAVTLTQAGSFATVNAGTGIVVTTSDSIGGAQAGNYALTQPAGLSADITPKGLTVSGSTAGNKVYDQTSTATITGGALVGVISGDAVTLTQAGSFATVNAGTGIVVTTSDSIGGAQAGNYALSQPTGLSADITPKGLTVSGSTAGNKVYDQTTTATITGGTLVGVISGDVVTLTQAGNFATANAGTGIVVTTSDSIGGAQVGNYTLTQPTGLAASITPKGLTVSGSSVSDKVYDRSTTATITGGTLAGVIAGDAVTLVQAGNFATMNAGNGIAVTASDTLSGAQAGNYAVIQPGGLSADITPKGLTVSGSTVGNKAYDQTTTATITGGTLVGVISGDVVTLTQAGNFATANAGTGIVVTTSDSIGGADLGNYTLTQPTGLAASITPKGLTVSGSSVSDKVYDRSTTATITGGTLAGVIAGDAVTLVQAGNFTTMNAGNGIAVTASDTLSGAQAGNYAVIQPGGLSADITPKGLTVSGSTVGNKAYDQTTTATITGGTLVGVISGDAVTLTQAGNFVSANAANVIVVNASDALGGADFGNYTLTQPTGLAASITPKGLTVSGSSVSDKVYDRSTTATITGGTLGGVIAGDAVTLVQAGNFATMNAGNGIAVTASDTLSGAQAGNYAVIQPGGLSADITPKGLTVSGSTVGNKAYDQTSTATITGGTLVGVISGDAVTLTQAGNFVSANAANVIVVNASDALGGADLGNYTLTQPTGLAASITPKGLTVSGSSVSDKVYDRSTTATITGGTLAGVIAGDAVTLVQAGNFATMNAGNGIAVTASDTLSGAQAGNYAVIQPGGLSASITSKSVTLQGGTGLNKVYDGNTDLPAAGYGALNGIIAGDSVQVQGTATYATPNAGNQAIVQGSVALMGATAGNYALVWANGAGAISRAALTVVANNDARFVIQSDAAGYNGVNVSGFVNGETSAVLGGSAVITRSNPGTNGAGTYAGVLVPGGWSSTNYTISFVPGSYTIVPANQLLVRLPNAQTVYGSSAAYGPAQTSYLASDNTTIVDLSGSTSTVGNAVTVNDAAGGTASFTVVPVNARVSAGGALAVGSYQLGAGQVSATSANFSNKLVIVGAQQVDAKGITLNPGGVTKVYDGNVSIPGLQLSALGLIAGDSATPVGTGEFASRNVGTGLAYSVNGLDLTGADAGNYFVIGGSTQSGNNGVITPKLVTLTAPVVSKVYDGSAAYAVDTATLAALGQQLGVAGDLLSSISLVFTDKNVATGTSLAASNATIADGNGGGNYQVSYATSQGNSITRLASVTWVGGAAGNWFDPANWAGGAVPDLANVANVVIPANVTVIFGPAVVAPAQAGPVQIDSLGTAGTLAMPGGQLTVGSGGINLGAVTQSGGSLSSTGPVALGSLNQTGGSLATDGNFSITTNFAQSGVGTVVVGGSTQITDTGGGATLGNLSSSGPLTVTSTDGPINQQPGTVVKAAGSTTLTASQGGAPTNITLDGANQLGGPVSANGANLALNSAGPLTLANVSASGNLTLQSNGALNLGTSQVGGNLKAGSGGGHVNQSGPLQVGGSTTIDAGTGSVVLVDAGNLFGGQTQTSGGTVNLFNPADNGSAPVSAAQIASAVLTASKDKAGGDEIRRAGGVCSAVMQLRGMQGMQGTQGAQGTQGTSASASRVRSSRGDLRGASFGFALPAAVAGAVRAQPGSPAARLATGAALPGWLMFDAERLQLSTVAVPPGGLPIDVTIDAGTTTVPLRIEAQAWDGSPCSLR